jgi:hypothetical protein
MLRDVSLDAQLKNCIFYSFAMYEFYTAKT